MVRRYLVYTFWIWKVVLMWVGRGGVGKATVKLTFEASDPQPSWEPRRSEILTNLCSLTLSPALPLEI